MNRLFISAIALSCLLLAGCSPGKSVDTSSGAYGKAAGDATLPPQGRPPAPGADMSKRGGSNSVPR